MSSISLSMIQRINPYKITFRTDKYSNKTLKIQQGPNPLKAVFYADRFINHKLFRFVSKSDRKMGHKTMFWRVNKLFSYTVLRSIDWSDKGFSGVAVSMA